MWSCHKMFYTSQKLQYYFFGRIPEKEKKHLFPVFVMLQNEMQNGRWVTEGASIFPLDRNAEIEHELGAILGLSSMDGDCDVVRVQFLS